MPLQTSKLQGTLYLASSVNFNSAAKEIRIKARTQRLVPIVDIEMRSLLISGSRTYQPGAESGTR